MASSGKQEVEISTQQGKPLQRLMPTRFMHPFDEFEQLFDRFFGRTGLRPWSSPLAGFGETLESRLPAVDLVDRDDELVVRAEVPGVEKKDLDVSMTDNTVTIKGSTSHEEKEEKGDYYRCEISRGTFTRTVTLPCNVDAAKVKATLKDGVLEIVLPKAEKSKRQSITIT